MMTKEQRRHYIKTQTEERKQKISELEWLIKSFNIY